MIQPMVYGYSPYYDGTDLSGDFSWQITNPQSQVLEMMASTNDMAYGIPYQYYKNIHPKLTIIPQASSVVNPFRGANIHPNGLIYFAPNDETGIGEFNPDNKSLRLITLTNLASTSNKYVGGVVAPNGVIYYLPTASYTYITKFNPYTRAITQISKPVNTDYNGAILAPNGFIYGIPASSAAGEIMVFDWVNDTYTTFGNTGGDAYFGGALAPNGKIYCPPFGTQATYRVLVINTNNNSISYITTPTQNNNLYNGAVCAPNGKIYCIPYNADKVLEIDPDTNTGRDIGTNLSTQLGISIAKYCGGFLAPDNFIYAIPYAQLNKTFLKIDWMTGQTSLVTYSEIPSVSSAKYCGGVLATDGSVYVASGREEQVLKLDFGGLGIKQAAFSRELNKF